MTFGPDHYVPVLKLKRGEKRALTELSPAIRAQVTPLFEVVERSAPSSTPPELATHLTTAFNGLGAAVNGFVRYFLDCREIAPDGTQGAQDAFARAAALPTPFTPVTGLSRVADLGPALAHRTAGLAIRITRAEFESGRVPRQLPAFVAKHALVPEEIDVIVDLGAVDTMVTPGIEAMTDLFLADVPHPTRWRTLTVSGCAFPPSMGGIARSSTSTERVNERETPRA